MNSYTWVHQCRLTSKDLYQFCADTGCSLEDLPGVMIGIDGERESGNSVLSAQLDGDDDLNSYPLSLGALASLQQSSTSHCAPCGGFLADWLASVPDSQSSKADLESKGPWLWLGHLHVG